MSSWGLPVRTVPDSLLGQRAVEILRQAVARRSNRRDAGRCTPTRLRRWRGLGLGRRRRGLRHLSRCNRSRWLGTGVNRWDSRRSVRVIVLRSRQHRSPAVWTTARVCRCLGTTGRAYLAGLPLLVASRFVGCHVVPPRYLGPGPARLAELAPAYSASDPFPATDRRQSARALERDSAHALARYSVMAPVPNPADYATPQTRSPR